MHMRQKGAESGKGSGAEICAAARLYKFVNLQRYDDFVAVLVFYLYDSEVSPYLFCLL